MSEAPDTPEFSRIVDIREADGRSLELQASAAECAALAGRFGLVAIDSLKANVTLIAEGTEVDAEGTLKAQIVQSCAVSGEDLPVFIQEPLAFRFVPDADEAPDPDQEIEFEKDELDEIPYDGSTFDLGEAVAQSLVLAIDPYATGPDADAVREEKGLTGKAPDGPLQKALGAALKKSG